MKDDKGKPDYTLVPVAILDAIEKVREYGTEKYEDRENWKSVTLDRYWRAFLRHTRACWDDPDKIDEESGLPHLWHIACNLAFILEIQAARGKAEGLKQEEPKQEVVKDGTLFVDVPKVTDVTRVIVSEEGTIFCRTFYQDGTPQKWIPCSERQPGEGGTYLTTTGGGRVRVNHYYSDHGTWGYKKQHTQAWMPLPKPYKEKWNEGI